MTTSPPSANDEVLGQAAALRRIRTLLYTAPLHELEANKRMRGADWAPFDTRTLQLAAIDFVVDRQGFEGGVGRELVENYILALCRQMAPKARDDLCHEVAKEVVSWLLNEGSAESGFVYEHADPASGLTRPRPYAVEMLNERQVSGEEFAVRASIGAINLLIGSLDVDIADAQQAEERLLDDYIERHNFDKAIESARRAQRRSVQYTDLIEAALKAARHDLAHVDWSGALLAEVSAAQEHIHGRLSDENRMRHNLQEMISDPSTLGDAADLKPLHQLMLLIDDCHERHTRLHNRLMHAGETFLREQENQSFAPPASLRIYDLNSQILRSVLALPAPGAVAALSSFTTYAVGPRPPQILGLFHFLDEMLAPRRDLTVEGRLADEPELDEEQPDDPFTPEVVSLAEEVFAVARLNSQRLSELFGRARLLTHGDPEERRLLLALVRLEALWAYAPDPRLRQLEGIADTSLGAVVDGSQLEDLEFGGDDLLVARREVIDAR